MKKITKKFMAAALTGIMVLAMGAFPSFAAQGNDGQIVITNPSVDVTYSAYKIFDMDYTAESNGDGPYYVYTIDNTSNFFSAVQAYAGTTKEGDEDPDGLTLTRVGTSSTYNVTIDESKFSAADFGAALKAVENKGTAAATETDTTTTGKLSLTPAGLDYGYYMVVGTTTVDGVTTTESLVSLDSTNPTANIIEKNSTPGWHSEDPDPDDPDTPAQGKTIKITEGSTTKYVETADMNIGDTVTFTIKIDAKNYDGKNLIKNYIIKDNLPDGFTFGSITAVKVGEKTLTAVQDGAEAEKDQYKNNDFPAKDGVIGSIEIPWATGSDDTGWTSNYAPSTVITVEYTATLDSDAVIDGDGNVNKAAFTYEYGKTPENPNPDPTPTIPDDPEQWTETDTATVYTYAIALKKINKSGEPLTGATFELPSGLKVSEATDENGNRIENTYVVDESGSITSITTEGDDASFTIIGLAAGTYELTETKAPDKYNLLTRPVEVTAQRTGKTTTETTTFYINEKGEVVTTETTVSVTYENDDYAVTPYAVVNFTGAELPSTGGVGTTMFYVIGIICVAGAAVVLVTKRRMTAR